MSTEMNDKPAMAHDPVDYRPLPASVGIDLSAGQDAGRYVDMYTDYAAQVSAQTPRSFHLSAALALISAVIARRLVVPLSFGPVYPNIYVLWLAVTGRFTKSTAMSIARGLMLAHFPYLLAPSQVTPEALLSELAGAQPSNNATTPKREQKIAEKRLAFCAQQMFILDEFGGNMAQASRDYSAGLLEDYMRLYDCDPRYERLTRGQGRIVVRNAYVTLLAAGTPAGMQQHLASVQLWERGWWPRFALLTPHSERPDYTPLGPALPMPVTLPDGLLALHDRLPKGRQQHAPENRVVQMTPAASELWQRYHKALIIDLGCAVTSSPVISAYARYAVHTLKVATLVAASDWTLSSSPDAAPRIDVPEMARAISIVEDWRYDLHLILDRSMSSMRQRLHDDLLGLIARQPGGATLRDLKRTLRGTEQRDIEAALGELMRTREIEQIDLNAGGPGRSSPAYRLLPDPS